MFVSELKTEFKRNVDRGVSSLIGLSCVYVHVRTILCVADGDHLLTIHRF